MWKNFIKIAWRQFISKIQLSTIKVIGLGIGIAASLMLIQYISWQWNFDRFHDKIDQIVRIENDHFRDGVLNSKSAMTAAGVPVVAKDHFPEVANYARLGRWIANDVIFRFEENLYRGNGCYFTEPSFFDIFSFEMILGDPQTALEEPNALVLTASTAKKLFGDTNPIGKEVLFENFKTFHVTGVVQDPPSQSHLQFDILGSLTTMHDWGLQVYANDQYSAAYVYAYLEVRDGTNLPELENELTKKLASLKAEKSEQDVYKLQPLERIHLYSELDHEMGDTGQGNNIWILAGIALLILILGWVNHFNLFAASSLDQSQSISIRRIVGADRKHVFGQIAISSFMYSLAGILLGFLISALAQPILENTFGIPFRGFSLVGISAREPSFYLLVLLIIGTLSNAIIPAIFLSRIQPIELLQKNMAYKPSSFTFRKILVTTQFIIIIGLIACTVIIYQQASHMHEKDLGLNLENVLAIRAPLGVHYEDLPLSFPKFEQEVKKIPGVTMLSVSHQIPGNELKLIESLKAEKNEYSYSFYRNYGDSSYFKLYGIPPISDFLPANLAIPEKRYAVINKMASELLGYKDPNDALGKVFERWETELEIVGVVDNYHQRSLHHATVPIIYDFSSDRLMTDGYYSLKVSEGADLSLVKSSLKKAFEKAFPYTVFEFLDVRDHFNAQYEADNHFKQLNLGFTVLAVIIAALGLLGLIMITLERRIKEMSIRKVLGASASNLVILLSKEILILTMIAWAIATPVSWYLMKQWLNNFSSRIEIGWPVFLGAVILVALLATLTVGIQTLKASLANPATILRDE